MNCVVVSLARATQVGSKALEMVSELRQSGLTMDQDFVWRFEKGSYGEGNEFVSPSVTFEFEDPALATFYQLKWSTP
jgi:hypothetical protein